MNLSRIHVFDLIAILLERYGEAQNVKYLLMFSFSMMRDRPDGYSADEALLDTFERLAPAQFASLPDALRVSADFIDEEVCGVWKIDEGHHISHDLRVAAEWPERAPSIVHDVFFD